MPIPMTWSAGLTISGADWNMMRLHAIPDYIIWNEGATYYAFGQDAIYADTSGSVYNTIKNTATGSLTGGVYDKTLNTLETYASGIKNSVFGGGTISGSTIQGSTLTVPTLNITDLKKIEVGKYVPFITRGSEYCTVFTEYSAIYNYLIARAKVTPTMYAATSPGGSPTTLLENETCSWSTQYQYSTGSYEWYGRMSGSDHGKEYMGFIRHVGSLYDGLSAFCCIEGVYYTWTISTAGISSQQVAVGADWTGNDHYFQMFRSSSSVDFYVDSIKVNQHTSGLPSTTRMSFWGEASTQRGSATTDAAVLLTLDSFQKV